VTRFDAANLKKGRIRNPDLAKLEAMARAIGFRRLSGFGNAEGEGRTTDETLRWILEGALGLRPKGGRLLVIARQISTLPIGG
jgi:hypothetical protein